MDRVCIWLFGVALLFGGVGVASAQDDPATQALEDSPRHQEWVQIDAGEGRMVRAYVVYPEVDHAATAVVVIHENRGLNDWARSLADQLAARGYVAVAPDFLSGTGPDGGGTDSYESSDAAREGIYNLTLERVMGDLDAAVDYARGLDATTDTVAVAGFCWGGGQAFEFATHNDTIAAAFVFYGRSVTDGDLLARIDAPVFGFYGGNDQRITASVPETEAAMREAEKLYEPVVYEGAGHGFMRSGEADDAGDADKAARTQAWERWERLLEEL